LIDALTFTGSYPFRRVRAGIEDVVNVLRPEGFTDIFTLRFEALFYRDFNEGNKDLLNEYRGRDWSEHGVRVHLLAGLNPFYISSINEIKNILEDFKAVVLAPLYQGFNISAKRVINIVRAANNPNLPVIIFGYLEDIREMHRAYRFRYSLGIDNVKEFLELLKKSCSDARVALISFPFKTLSALANELSKLSVYIDVSYEDIYGPMYDYVKALVNMVGEDLVIFASKTPLTYVKSVLFKALYSEISSDAKTKILKHNAKKFFGL